jgi:hypothetical protein
MRTPRLRRSASIAGLATLALGTLGLVLPAEAGASTPATAYVINSSYAKKVGFPAVAIAAKSSSNTGEKNCGSSAESAYENASHTVGLVSETLLCKTAAAAAAAYHQARSQSTASTTISVPKALGSTSFATAAEAPQYTIVWQHGARVGVTAIDTDVAASSTETGSELPAAPLTPGQAKVLAAAAVAQNLLLGK